MGKQKVVTPAADATPTFRLEDYAPFDLAMDQCQSDEGYVSRFIVSSVVFRDTLVDSDVEIKYC
jgi:hypothetical protein